MNSLKKIMMVALTVLAITQSNAQIKNAKIETVKIYGNCGMCKSKIDKAGSQKNIAEVVWNKDTKMATLTYDAKKTNQEDILKKIALAGYDSDFFLAPEKAYSSLNGCCQYDREAKVAIQAELKSEVAIENIATVSESQEANQLQPVFDTYLALKDALVKTDGNAAAAKSKELLFSIKAVKMETLKSEVHVVWMKVINPLIEHSEHISDTKEVSHQRDHFSSLSTIMYELIKVSKLETTVYYQFCPMAKGGKGANWLSKESAIKNPYYGSQMLTCGKVVETIK
jgi:copper chaperone CopZ